MKVADLSGAELDYWVAIAEGETIDGIRGGELIVGLTPNRSVYAPSHKWHLGGPIIEREGITVQKMDFAGRTDWQASTDRFLRTAFAGPTPIIAAMRAYVASKFGDEVPEEK